MSTYRRDYLQVCILAVFPVLLIPWLFDQTSPHAQTLRSTTRVVNLNVVVTDAQGHPVKGLTRTDFTIFDNGQRQQITFFNPIDNLLQVPHVSGPGPDTYTNNPEMSGAPPSVTILLFDTLNSRWASQGYGLNRVRDFLSQIRAPDHIGIYVLGDRLLTVHSFSGDSSDIIAAIDRYQHRHPPTPEEHAMDEKESADDKALDRFLEGDDNRYRFELSGKAPALGYATDKLIFANQMTMASLDAIARELSSVPGRKTLVWVTDSVGPMSYFMSNEADPILRGWRADGGTRLPAMPAWQSGTDVEQMIQLMNDAGIAVYTVDARGLQTERLGFRSSPNAAPVSSPTDPVASMVNRTPAPNGALLALAQRTGGRAFYNRNDLETGIRRALDDSRFTYAIAYRPDHDDWKGEWRKIQVKVDRPGAMVLARSGYFALPAPQLIPAKDRYRFLEKIAASPVDSAQLPFGVHISVPPKTRQISATVDISPQSLARMLIPETNGHAIGHFEVMFMQVGAKDKLLDAMQKQINADLNADGYSNSTRTGWSLSVRLPLKSAAKTLCVILHDEGSDAIGSIHIPLARYMAPTL